MASLRSTPPPDYENPEDSNNDNVYKVTVRASDGRRSTDRDVTVTVTNEAPTIDSGPFSPDYAEGGTGSVGRYRASDPGGGSITWSLPNTFFESDRGDFSISSSGFLTFDSPPDYENPEDSNDDNVYRITVRASDGRLSASRNVTVTVTDVDEPPSTPGAPTVTAAIGSTTNLDVSWIAPANSGKPPITSYDLQYRQGTTGNFQSGPQNVTGTRTAIPGLQADTLYQVQVRATNADGNSAYSSSSSGRTNAPSLPTLTIARHSSTAATVDEGTEVRFTLTADPVPAANLTVHVNTTQTGSFIERGPLPFVTVTGGTSTLELRVQTADDDLDEAHGSITVAVQQRAGYTIGNPSTASVTVRDDDVPPAPTVLRANGHLVNGKVTLRWNPVPGATGYNLHYAEEVCTLGVGCEPDGGLANPNWQPRPNIATSGSAVKEATLAGLTEGKLYRLEVQSVVVDSSDWSDAAFVYPTGNPLTSTTSVALMEIRDFQADGQNAGSYRYTTCLSPTASGAWTATEIVAEIKASIETWETAVRDSSILSTTADPVTSLGNCEDPEFPSTSNQVVFVSDRRMGELCRQDFLGCWQRLGGDLSRGLPFDRQSLLLKASGGGTDWDTMTSGCSRLRTVVAHEVGHALGIKHLDIGPIPPRAVRNMYLMYCGFQGGLCGPQAYDVVAAMANYQSR